MCQDRVTQERCGEVWQNHPGTKSYAIMSGGDLRTMGMGGVTSEGVVNNRGEWTRIDLDEQWTRGRSDKEIREEFQSWVYHANDGRDRVRKQMLNDVMEECDEEEWRRRIENYDPNEWPNWSILDDVRQKKRREVGDDDSHHEIRKGADG